MCKYRELSFDWSHHRILCTDWKVRFTLQNSIKHSGSERVFKGNCKKYICHYFCFYHYFLLLMVIKNRKNWHCIYNEWPQRNDLLKKSRHEDKQCTFSSGIRDLRLLQTLQYWQIVCLCFSRTLHKMLSCILTSSGPVYTLNLAWWGIKCSCFSLFHSVLLLLLLSFCF